MGKDNFQRHTHPSASVSLSVNKAGNTTATKAGISQASYDSLHSVWSKTPGDRKSYLHFSFQELSNVTHMLNFL